MNGKALKTGSKSEDLQGVYIFDGFEERPEENARTVSGFYYSLSKVFLSSRLMVSDNYFAIIIERSMNLTDGMSSVCKMHAFFEFKVTGVFREHSIENICLLLEKCVYLQRVINKRSMNMKKIVGFLMVALLALMALPANAQLKFGIKGGVNISSVHFNSDVLKADNVTGFQVGPMIETTLPLVGVGIDVAVLYSQKVWRRLRLAGLRLR